MSVTVAQAKTHLNITDTADDTELAFFVAAANEWIAKRVSDTTPTPVQLGTLELVRHLWDSQRGPAAGPLDDGTFSLGLLGFAVPTRVLELIDLYLTSTTPAPTSSFPAAPCWPDPAKGW